MKIAIAFATLSGNTEMIAKELQKFLFIKFPEVDLLNLENTNANKLKDYGLIFLGCSTYGDGDLNLIIDIFLSDAQNSNYNCQNTKFAVFSLGDSLYSNFAVAGSIVEEKIMNMGGRIISPGIKIDGYPDQSVFDEVKDWASKILKKVQTENQGK